VFGVTPQAIFMALFSEGPIGSPVSGTALGECNAIRSHGCGLGELTLVGILETDFGASHKPVSG
jgi:hypothetical protein